MSIPRFSLRTSGSYSLTATVTDSAGELADVSDPAVVITDTEGTEIDSGTPAPASTGVLVYELDASLIEAAGLYFARFSGGVAGLSVEWVKAFQVVDGLAYPFLDEVKRELRITTDVYDSDLERHIAAAKADLRMSGVSAAVTDADFPEPLVRQAIVVYCKAQFGLDNPDSEKYMASFHAIEASLALSTEYGGTSL